MLQTFLAYTAFMAFLFFFIRKPSYKVYILAVIYGLPLMNSKLVPAYYGGFTVFDFLSYFSFSFLMIDFIKVYRRYSSFKYFILFFAFLTVVILGMMNSSFTKVPFLRLLKILPIFIFVRFVIIAIYNNVSFVNKIISGLKLICSVSIVFMVLQIMIGLSFSFYEVTAPNTLDLATANIRYPGYFYDSQANGQYLAIISFITLYSKTGFRDKKYFLNVLFFIIMAVLVLFAGSRSAFGGLLVGGLIIMLFHNSTFRNYTLGVSCLVGLVFLLFTPSMSIFKRADNLDKDYLFRLSIWEETLDIVENHPKIGIGLDNFEDYTKKYKQDLYLELAPSELVYFDQPESGYLKILAENGIIGFALFISFFAIPILGALKAQIKGQIDRQSIIFIAPLICWLIAFSTVYSIFDERILILVGIFCGLLIGTVNTKNEYHSLL